MCLQTHLHRFHRNPNYISSVSQSSHCFGWTAVDAGSVLQKLGRVLHKTTVCPFTHFIKVIMPWHIFKSNTLSLCKRAYPAYLRTRHQISFQHCGKCSWQIHSCNVEFNGFPWGCESLKLVLNVCQKETVQIKHK